MLAASRTRIGCSRVPAGDAAGEQAAAQEGALEPALAVHAAAAESGGFPGREEPVDHLPIVAEHAAGKVRADAAHALAADDVLADCHQRARAPVEDRLECAGADAVARPAPQPRDPA